MGGSGDKGLFPPPIPQKHEIKSVRGQGAGRRPGASNCWTVCPMSTVGNALRPPTEQRWHPYPCILLPPASYRENHQPRANPNPFSCEPLIKPLSPLRIQQEREKHRPHNPASRPSPHRPKPMNKTPIPHPRTRQEREKHRPRAPLRGPGPHRHHLGSGRAWSVPGGSRSEDDPCHGLRRLRTGGACGFFIIPHRCDIVNTLVGRSDGFFCHSVKLKSGRQNLCPQKPPVHGSSVGKSSSCCWVSVS